VRRILLVLVLAAVLLPASPQHVFAATGLDQATRAVVAVTVQGQIVGSGVVVASGYVLTAAHVADDVASYSPRVLRNGSEVPFGVVAIDRTRDLALLKADTDAIVPVTFAYPGSLVQGQDVVALGFPIGLTAVSLTKGVVSSLAQDFQGATFVQTDAAINPGNSGGALVDDQGRLVGINVAKVTGGGVDTVGFAVPVADALAFVRASAPGAQISIAASPAQNATDWTLIAAATGILVLTLAYLSVRLRTHAARGELTGPPPVPESSMRRTFHVVGTGRDEVVSLRLPAVIGSAANADIHVTDAGVGEYQARIGLEALGTVTITDLVGNDGLYCGDMCVQHAVIEPGLSFRVGNTEITLVERRG
jgi:hypothetical protein